MQKNRLYGSDNKPYADHSTDDYGPGQLVYTRERARREYEAIPLLNPDFGLDMTQNGSFGGNPILIHDGTDTAAYTGSQILGSSVDFASTTAGKVIAGSMSVEIDGPAAGDVWQFAGGSINVVNYSALSMTINIDKNWTLGDSVSMFGWDTGGGVIVGNTVLLEDYMDEFVFDADQSVVIPLSDMGLTSGTVDAFRMEQVGKHGATATWYLDSFNVQQTSGALDFEFAPPVDLIFHVELISHFVINDVTETVMNDHDKYFGEPALTNGVAISVRSEGNTQLGVGLKDLETFLQFPHIRPFETIPGASSTQAKVTTEFDFILDGRKQDFFRYTIQDDLSDLQRHRVWLYGWLEKVAELNT